ncbi:hypothetical protein KHA80_20450 [Anaerobacillus sp. HL2]|nr:hypothetical protein KHA80_20450 [Anaerobacillus sp. HL2]
MSDIVGTVYKQKGKDEDQANCFQVKFLICIMRSFSIERPLSPDREIAVTCARYG